MGTRCLADGSVARFPALPHCVPPWLGRASPPTAPHDAMIATPMKPTKYPFSSLDLLLIIAALAGIVLVILPQFARSRARTKKIGCTNCLKQVSYAFASGPETAATSFHTSFGHEWRRDGFALRGSAYEVFLVMSNELSTPKILSAPMNQPKRFGGHCFGAVYPGQQSGWFRRIHAQQQFELLRRAGCGFWPFPNRSFAGDDHFLPQRQQQPKAGAIPPQPMRPWFGGMKTPLWWQHRFR